MKSVVHLVLIAFAVMLTSCKVEPPEFEEIVIDDAAPDHVWMKAIGDINNDGRDDLLVGGWQSGGLVAYLAPDWKRHAIVDTVRVSTDGEVYDMNNDGVSDIVAVVQRAIVWFEGPDWKIHRIDSVTAHDVEVDDFDGDGALEVVARNQGAFGSQGGHTLFIYDRDETGSWKKFTREIPDGEGLKKADINGDGKMDLVVNAHWYENTGDLSAWVEHSFSDTWTWPNTHIDVADINGDGRADILHSPAELVKNVYRVSWFEAPSDPKTIWKEHVIADSVEAVVHSIGAADFDEDGRMDVVVAEMQQGADPDEVIIYYNRGDNRWDKQVVSTGGCHSMQILDADGDGDLDFFGANFAENKVRMWINKKRHSEP